MSKSNVLKFCRSEINARINLHMLGNSNRGLKELAMDLLHDSKDDIDKIAAGTYLNKKTIINLKDGVTNYPRYDTIERIFKYFELDLAASQVAVKSRYQNKAKVKR